MNQDDWRDQIDNSDLVVAKPIKSTSFFRTVEEFVRGCKLVRDMPERFVDENGEPVSLRTMIAILKTEAPEAYAEISHQITQRWRAARFAPGANAPKILTPDQEEKRRQVEQANIELNITPPEIDHGIDFATSPDQWQDRAKFPSVAEARESVRQWSLGESKPILYVTGIPGVGKTMLAETAARAILDRGETIAYRTEPDMMAEIRRGMGDRTADAKVEALIAVRWLVIDDLGRENLTGTMATVWDRIIDGRWRSAGATRTLITTNAKRTDLPARIASRLGDRSLVTGVLIDAEDYRTTKGE